MDLVTFIGRLLGALLFLLSVPVLALLAYSAVLFYFSKKGQ